MMLFRLFCLGAAVVLPSASSFSTVEHAVASEVRPTPAPILRLQPLPLSLSTSVESSGGYPAIATTSAASTVLPTDVPVLPTDVPVPALEEALGLIITQHQQQPSADSAASATAEKCLTLLQTIVKNVVEHPSFKTTTKAYSRLQAGGGILALRALGFELAGESWTLRPDVRAEEMGAALERISNALETLKSAVAERVAIKSDGSSPVVAAQQIPNTQVAGGRFVSKMAPRLMLQQL